MAEALKSSARDRIRAQRRALVLDLATRHGPFWEAVRWLRCRWGIEAPAALPPPGIAGYVDATSTVGYVPAAWPDALLWPLPPDLAEDVGAEGPSQCLETRPAEGCPPEEWAAYCEPEWWADIGRLHDEVVPDAYTRAGPAAMPLWAPFLSACVVFDPPRKALFNFADRPPVMFDLPPGGAADEDDDPAAAGPRMIAAPIVYLQDPDRTAADADRYWHEVLGLVAHELRERGIDVDLPALVRDVIERHPKLSQRARKRDQANPSRPYIRVTRETTDDDVREARRLLRAALPDPPDRGGAPRREPLLCVQCAIWHDELGLPLARIAELCGWKIQQPGWAKEPTSETARAHVAEGRRILSERTPPAAG